VGACPEVNSNLGPNGSGEVEADLEGLGGDGCGVDCESVGGDVVEGKLLDGCVRCGVPSATEGEAAKARAKA
jgi:hypothetical protein